MTTRHVLQLMAELLAIGDRRGIELDLIPVLLTDYSASIQLIAEIARDYGAPVLQADGGQTPTADGVPAALPSVVLTEAIKAIPRDEGGELEVLPLDEGRCVVRAKDLEQPENPGSRNFLGTLSALLHDGLRGKSLAIIAYDQTDVDLPSRQALWVFLTETLPSLGAPLPTALVLCIGFREIDDQFLSQGTSLRYVLGSDSLVQRHSWETSQVHVARMASLTNPVVLFLGAGAGRSSGLPLGNEMRNEALRDFLQNEEGLSERVLIGRFFRWLGDNGRLLPEERDIDEDSFATSLTLERVLREEQHEWRQAEPSPTLQKFSRREAIAFGRPSEGIVALREVLRTQSRIVVVTVNFDRLIEDDLADVIVARDDDEFSRILDWLPEYLNTGDGPLPLLKLHGSIEKPDTIVANVEQTTLGLSPSKSEALASLLGTAGSPRPWIYVGYSMRDPDIVPELALPRFIERTDERWVSPVPSAFLRGESLQRREALWGEPWFNRCITETSDTFFKTWRDRLRAR